MGYLKKMSMAANGQLCERCSNAMEIGGTLYCGSPLVTPEGQVGGKVLMLAWKAYGTKRCSYEEIELDGREREEGE